MTILVIGGTGHVGSLVAGELDARGASVTVLRHKSAGKNLPNGVDVRAGDVRDVDFMRELLREARTVFLLNPVVPDELSRALLTLDLAREAGIERLAYFSMLNADAFSDTPHAAAKFGAERAIAKLGIPATILRPNYFFQNDVAQKGPLMDRGRYVMPIGGIGVAMVDTRDIAGIAASELIRRDQAADPLPAEVIEIVGPEVFTAQSIASLWSDVLGKPVSYGGDDLASTEEVFRKRGSQADAHDNVLMFRGFLRNGMLGKAGAAEQLASRLGRPLRTYRAFAEEQAAQWGKPILERVIEAVLPGARG